MKKIIFILLALCMATGVAFADETVADQLASFSAAFDMIWLIIAAALVFLMQAGFAMVETGLTRAKNAGNIIMKNLMDFSVGAIAYFAVGWAIMYGNAYAGEDGFLGFFMAYNPEVYDMSAIFRDWMFQVVFAATAATIVSGAMAERTKFTSYLLYSVVVSAVIYPVVGHWTWGEGFLYGLDFHDFAGSTIVHSTGGWAALAGAIMLGPRIGKYVKVDGKITVKAIQGHNLPLASLGVFILWFGWYGFNAGSTLSGTDTDIAHVAMTTTLAASAGAILAMITIWIIGGKPDPSMTLNGALAGLVGITAGTWVINPIGAIIVGAIAGVLVVLSVEFFDKILHIDDPVGAVSVHGVCGAWGTIAVGLFADGTKGGENPITGLFYGGGVGQLGVQLIGVVSVFVFVFLSALALFFVIKLVIGLRVSEKEELQGLDIEEHGSEAYHGFQIFTNL
ncbi:ammonium transporter [Spirochaeta cellobiosiphila]|uniref:ammonium transporter n=1 Tax=Spirochaeta cellobiosiphila TaxID=504483 RepID=UPI0004097C93|nr:ammonium transporter [Spirochaeta cellobiosiphila]